MIAGHVIVKGTEESIPFATVMILGTNRGAVSNEEGQFEFRKLAAGKYTRTGVRAGGLKPSRARRSRFHVPLFHQCPRQRKHCRKPEDAGQHKQPVLAGKRVLPPVRVHAHLHQRIRPKQRVPL